MDLAAWCFGGRPREAAQGPEARRDSCGANKATKKAKPVTGRRSRPAERDIRAAGKALSRHGEWAGVGFGRGFVRFGWDRAGRPAAGLHSAHRHGRVPPPDRGPGHKTGRHGTGRSCRPSHARDVAGAERTFRDPEVVSQVGVPQS